MEIAIVGEGEVLIRFIDRNGQTLMQEKLVISGSPTVEGRRTIDLSVKTIDGSVPLAPDLIRQSNPKQRVTFDGEPPSRFTPKRCKEIGCPAGITKDAARGRVAPPAEGGSSVRLSDDQTLARLIKERRGKAGRGSSGF
ncbi:MAG TPA: hypothetical protein VLA99_04230 [Nitrospiraceae bacterium]|nr:hypothetical protein [Nitrospiraceae bacterium]